MAHATVVTKAMAKFAALHADCSPRREVVFVWDPDGRVGLVEAKCSGCNGRFAETWDKRHPRTVCADGVIGCDYPFPAPHEHGVDSTPRRVVSEMDDLWAALNQLKLRVDRLTR